MTETTPTTVRSVAGIVEELRNVAESIQALPRKRRCPQPTPRIVVVHQKPVQFIENLQDLPKSVFFRIFEFLSIDDLLVLAEVSRKLKALTRTVIYRARLSLRAVPGAQIMAVVFKDSSGRLFADESRFSDSVFSELREINRKFSDIKRYAVDSLNLYMKDVDREIVASVIRLARGHFRPKYLEVSYQLSEWRKPTDDQLRELFHLLIGKFLVHFKLRIPPSALLLQRMLTAIDEMQLKKIELTQCTPEAHKILFERCLSTSGLFVSMPFPSHLSSVRPAHEHLVDYFRYMTEAIDAWKRSDNPGLYSFICITNDRPNAFLRRALLAALGLQGNDSSWVISHWKRSDYILRVLNRVDKSDREV